MKPLFAHQEETVQFLQRTPKAFIASSPGVGKTRSVIELVARLRAAGEPHRCLVLAPKSILMASWGADIRKFSDLTFVIADAANRKQIANKTADFIIVNHDGVKAIQKATIEKSDLAILVCDESTAYKHSSTSRSKAVLTISELFDRRILMSGTPNPNGVLDLWHQYKILDGGDLLGSSYYRFRAIVCEPQMNGQFTRWGDKIGSAEAVADLVRPITIRHRFDEVLDIPARHEYEIKIEIPKELRVRYAAFLRHTILELESGAVSAKNAGAKLNKLLQIASGAIYGEDGEAVVLDTSRYQLVVDLIEAREQCVVAFNWHHQSAGLAAALTAAGISFGVIDGSVSMAKRSEIVTEFQAGKLRVILAQPATASHGLTLTAGTTTIWASPTWNAEHFQQFNHRIYRAGQTRKTETISILAENTADEQVFEKLAGKLSALETLLAILNAEKHNAL